MQYSDFFQRATGSPPYDYQLRMAEAGLPELLEAPTGTGKTAAAVLVWLFRRLQHPDEAVRLATPHWLIYVLPLRVLVEQTTAFIGSCLKNLALEDRVGLHVVMGGEGPIESRWRTAPQREAILVGTLDMLISRGLNRGYAAGRFAWPMDFGLLHSGCQWVFDEVQLMGPALPTSRQLEGFRRKLGTAAPSSSMWMSATVDEELLATIDHPTIDSIAGLSADDVQGGLRKRLGATKAARRLDISDPKKYAAEMAGALLGHHRRGTRTIAVINTVKRAQEVRDALVKRDDSDVVLLHSRYRPEDRARNLQAALADPSEAGHIVVTTQVLEAGVDVTSATMFTEAAPWPSVVQRAGRCNREGETEEAVLLWTPPPKPHPYEQEDIDAAVNALERLEGKPVTATDMGKEVVPVKHVFHSVLRLRDLLGLFDTAPDLSGNDIDVSRFIRTADEIDVHVAWREIDSPSPNELPTRQELCPVPVGELREEIKKGRKAWRFDHLDEQWASCREGDLRPGMMILLSSLEGGYTPESGWDPTSKAPVNPVQVPESSSGESDGGVGADPLTWVPGRPVLLTDHLEDVAGVLDEFVADLVLPGLSKEHLHAVAVAARLHDIGKAHPVFQSTMLKVMHRHGHEELSAESDGPWAKPGGSGGHHSRSYFRHELVSALALLDHGAEILGAEPDLVRYLIAAHHGRVRMSIRSLPDERPRPEPPARVACGVWDGDQLPAVETSLGTIPPATIDLSIMEMGDGAAGPSWGERALILRDRPDLGPFRLGFLEAIVRAADWKASEDPSEVSGS